jgi:hypothetical protein
VPLAVLAKLPVFGQARQPDVLTWRWPLARPIDRAQYDAWREHLPLIMSGVSSAVAVVTTLPRADLARRLIDNARRVRLD